MFHRYCSITLRNRRVEGNPPYEDCFSSNGRPMGAPTGLIVQLYNQTPSGVPKQFAEGKLYHICVANISHPSKTDISHFPQENISLSNLSLSDKFGMVNPSRYFYFFDTFKMIAFSPSGRGIVRPSDISSRPLYFFASIMPSKSEISYSASG